MSWFFLFLNSPLKLSSLGLVKYALSKNQPVNSVMFGLQALHLASASGNLAICKMLVEAGADVNAPRLASMINPVVESWYQSSIRLSRKVNVSKEFLLGSTTGTTGELIPLSIISWLTLSV